MLQNRGLESSWDDQCVHVRLHTFSLLYLLVESLRKCCTTVGPIFPRTFCGSSPSAPMVRLQMPPSGRGRGSLRLSGASLVAVGCALGGPHQEASFTLHQCRHTICQRIGAEHTNGLGTSLTQTTRKVRSDKGLARSIHLFQPCFMFPMMPQS